MKIDITGTRDEIGHFVPSLLQEIDQLGGQQKHTDPFDCGGGLFTLTIVTEGGAPYRDKQPNVERCIGDHHVIPHRGCILR